MFTIGDIVRTNSNQIGIIKSIHNNSLTIKTRDGIVLSLSSTVKIIPKGGYAYRYFLSMLPM